VKSLDFKSFQASVRAVEEFWFGVVKLPEKDEAEKTAPSA
jgi:hypothetical protein